MTNALVAAAVLLLSGTAVQPVFAQAQVPDTVHIAPPVCEVVLVQGVGHFMMMEDPERFNELLTEVVEDLGG